MGAYVRTTKYLKFDGNWDLFCGLVQFSIRDLFAIKVQVKQECIKLIFKKISDEIEEPTKELDEQEF